MSSRLTQRRFIVVISTCVYFRLKCHWRGWPNIYWGFILAKNNHYWKPFAPTHCSMGAMTLKLIITGIIFFCRSSAKLETNKWTTNSMTIHALKSIQALSKLIRTCIFQLFFITFMVMADNFHSKFLLISLHSLYLFRALMHNAICWLVSSLSPFHFIVMFICIFSII